MPDKDKKVDHAVAMRAEGKSFRDIAAALGVSKSWVEQSLRKRGEGN